MESKIVQPFKSTNLNQSIDVYIANIKNVHQKKFEEAFVQFTKALDKVFTESKSYPKKISCSDWHTIMSKYYEKCVLKNEKELFEVFNKIDPNLLVCAIKRVPLILDCMFSSAMPNFVPLNKACNWFSND